VAISGYSFIFCQPIARQKLMQARPSSRHKCSERDKQCNERFTVGRYHNVLSQYDLIVIVPAPAGQAARPSKGKERQESRSGKREVIGGVCINTGTIPSKTSAKLSCTFPAKLSKHLRGQLPCKEKITMADLGVPRAACDQNGTSTYAAQLFRVTESNSYCG